MGTLVDYRDSESFNNPTDAYELLRLGRLLSTYQLTYFYPVIANDLNAETRIRFEAGELVTTLSFYADDGPNVPVEAPTQIRAERLEDGRHVIRWKDNSSHETGYINWTVFE